MRLFGGGVRGVAGDAVLSPAGRAGPRRLLAIGAGTLAVGALVAIVATTGSDTLAPSRDARQRPVDPLPGGLHSTPAQDAVARVAQEAGARQAQGAGVGYTPPMAPSRSVRDLPPGAQLADPLPPAEPARPRPQLVVAVPAPLTPAVPAPLAPLPVIPAAWRPVAPAAAPEPIQLVQATQAQGAPADPQAEFYRRQIGDLFSHWGSRAPRTDVIQFPPSRSVETEQGDRPTASGASTQRVNAPARPVTVVQAPPADARSADGPEVLVPAGRGVYARTVLAVASDATSPVVLEATSGPIAGARMIGSFSREDERLIIRVSSLTLSGQTIGVDGVVVAPDTMEAGVASGVDQQYLRRFALPAAAAFVQGLGQAIASTSRVAGVLSPFGGVGFTQDLNIGQQLGIAAGAAAARIGQTLNQDAPRGPRVTLDVGSTVGVMFLSNVTSRGQK